jgi:signal transduction histidine kinase/ActR/RegA family two-component response regulator
MRIRPFRQVSVQGKLMSMLMASSGAALLVACATFMIVDVVTLRSSTSSTVSTVADIIASQSAAALAFQDQTAAKEILQSASAANAILSAAIVAQDESVVAVYTHADIPELTPLEIKDWSHSTSRILRRPIILDGEQIGTLYVQSATPAISAGLMTYAGISGFVFLAWSFIAFLLSSRLQRVISDPIAQLARTMRLVSSEKNYSVRATKRTEDELGILIDGFNKMLSQIQQRDVALEKARNELEQRVQERTRKLQQEIVERTRLEQQLLQAQKMEALGQLAGGIAHDFNNLLTVITGNLSLARLGSRLDDKTVALLQAAEQGAHRASDLTRQLLAVGRRTFSLPQALDLHDVVREVVEILRRTIDPRIVIETPAAEIIWYVHADSGQMFQALMNLCMNARDAMPEGGRLRIALENVTREKPANGGGPRGQPECFVRLTVSDTGIGMEESVCRRVFEPFFTTKEVGKGTGLGLAMAYGIITQNKGTITVESTPGMGSRFMIELPRHIEMETDAEFSAEVISEKAAPQTPERSGETVLVVEDEDAIRKLARTILEQVGFMVLEAEDGVRGLDVYKKEQNRIAAVILDLTMPKRSGLEVLASLRRVNPEVRVILCSGYSAAAQKLDLVKIGVMAFLQKPYTPAELARTLCNVLDQN